jgi:hypothetical protein
LLAHLGSGADVFGLRLPLAADVVGAIKGRYPRGDLATEIAALTDRHAGVHPYGQLAGFRALGLRPLDA